MGTGQTQLYAKANRSIVLGCRLLKPGHKDGGHADCFAMSKFSRSMPVAAEGSERRKLQL